MTRRKSEADKQRQRWGVTGATFWDYEKAVNFLAGVDVSIETKPLAWLRYLTYNPPERIHDDIAALAYDIQALGLEKPPDVVPFPDSQIYIADGNRRVTAMRSIPHLSTTKVKVWHPDNGHSAKDITAALYALRQREHKDPRPQQLLLAACMGAEPKNRAIRVARDRYYLMYGVGEVAKMAAKSDDRIAIGLVNLAVRLAEFRIANTNEEWVPWARKALDWMHVNHLQRDTMVKLRDGKRSNRLIITEKQIWKAIDQGLDHLYGAQGRRVAGAARVPELRD